MKALDHPNIVVCFGSKLIADYFNIIIEWMPGWPCFVSPISTFVDLSAQNSRFYLQYIIRYLVPGLQPARPACLSLRFNGHFPGEPGLAGVC